MKIGPSWVGRLWVGCGDLVMNEQATEFEQAIAIAMNLSPLEKVRLVEQVMATLEQDLAPKKSKRTSYGLWAGVSISSEDIDETRNEMWNSFPRDDI